MPGRRRLTTLLYAFPERTERCSFPTPIHPPLLLFVALFFFPSTATFPPPLLSASSSLYLPLFYPSFPFPYSTRCSALPATRHLSSTSFHFSSLDCAPLSLCPRVRGTEELEKKTNLIYIYIYTLLFSLPLLFFHLLSASIGTRLPKLHRLPLALPLPPSLPSFRPSARFFGATA